MEAEEQFSRDWTSRVSLAVKELLESKHLYQSVRLPDPDGLASTSAKQVDPGAREAFGNVQVAWALGRWSLSGPSDTSYLGRGGSVRPLPGVQLPGIKIFCRVCERIEAFNPLSGHDCVPEGVRDNAPSPVVQLFAVSFLCQSCRSFPEFFLVRREGLKLTLSGRSPIEHVTVPRVIPKQIAKFFSGAVVAHQSGQTLAALFLLRTMIEQWVRSLGHEEGRIDAALESYCTALPIDFKTRFPSLTGTYGELSTAIHEAQPSVDLFDRTIHNLEVHFDARRLFQLS